MHVLPSSRDRLSSRVPRSSRVRRGALAALCAAAVLTLPACGTGSGDDNGPAGKSTGSAKPAKAKKAAEKPAPFADLSGPQVMDKAFAATRAATSLTLKADMPDPEGRIAVDVALDKKGDCAGTMSMNGQGTVTLTKTGPTVYMKYDEAVLRSQGKGQPQSDVDAAVKMLANRWVKTDAKDPDAKDLVGFCDLDGLLSAFEGGDSVARKGPVTTVDGQPALTLTESDGSSDYTVHVATEGKPYLLNTSWTGKEKGEMTFSQFDRPVDAKAPADKDVLDLASLDD
ncbi:hypothetical protein [Streptomyces liangshanensis]|uniref:hypothetical protein n=1 Tax=Streptomyces liangshanensis TaxID=2717324 RepID=UPI0036DF593A